MLTTKRISRCGRNHHLSLPKRWCERVGTVAGATVTIRGKIEGREQTWARRVVAHARGLHVAVPLAWRRYWDLTYGSPAVLLLGEGPVLTLQPLEGCSPKEWEARGMVEWLERLEQMERRLAEIREASYAQGLFTGHTQGYVQGLRSRHEQPPSREGAKS